MKKFKNSTVAGAFLLATSPAWANSKTGTAPFPIPGNTDGGPQSPPTRNAPRPSFPGKSQIEMASVTLEKADAKKLRSCTVPKVNLTHPRPQHLLSFAVNKHRRQEVTLQFAIDKIPSGNEERVLLLLYSRCLSNKPKIRTPMSRQKLALDVNDIEILATYKLEAATKPSRPGAPMQQMTVNIELETDKLAQQIKAGNNTFYFQAGVLKKTDFDRKNYGVINLSQLAALHFTTKTCPNEAQFSSRIKAENASCKHLPTKTQ
ncbi:conserved hypothetical protein, secreted [Candidatus Thiomargarita nelsonii]|uniref:Secreted protein n=1 Tax=Candidatus Thiomargarita nelsonii TaxID=1003181 RepID=A0A176RVG2_9GAMM|nr:conserved hypothetical protein, secreted [Candidatus Thiomargarita nelsonii]